MRVYAIALAFITVAALPAHADCTSDVGAAFQKLRSSKAFRMETKIVNAQGRLKMKVDYNPPDKMYQRVSLDDSEAQMELIVIGGKAWSNQGQGWAELPEKFAGSVAGQVQSTLSGLENGDAKYACAGEEDLEGKKVALYRADLQANEATSLAGKSVKTNEPPNVQTVYIDVATGLPARNVVVDGKDPAKRLFDGWFKVSDEFTVAPPLVPEAKPKP